MAVAHHGLDVTLVDDLPRFAIGERVVVGTTAYRYVKATAAITAGSVYKISSAFVFGTALDNTNDDAPSLLGVAPITEVTAGRLATAASNTGVSAVYLWVQVQGNLTGVLALASCAANVALYSSATAGAVDDTATNLILVPGLYLTSAVGAGGSAVTPAFACIDLATRGV